MGDPLEILISPFSVYLAPVGETFPDVDTAPGGNWALLGKNGLLNMDESGVTLTHEQTIIEKTPLGATGPTKAARTNEKITVAFTLMDMTVETYAKVLNGKTATTTAAASGTPGYVSMYMRQGTDVKNWALLLRGASPYMEGGYAQFKFPVVYQSDNPAPVFSKGDAAMLKCTFTVLEDPNAATAEARMGSMDAQNAVALA
jgi:hypothetical protein